jgi:hypothetical protein
VILSARIIRSYAILRCGLASSLAANRLPSWTTGSSRPTHIDLHVAARRIDTTHHAKTLEARHEHTSRLCIGHPRPLAILLNEFPILPPRCVSIEATSLNNMSGRCGSVSTRTKGARTPSCASFRQSMSVVTSPSAVSATTSANCRPSATPSTSTPPLDRGTGDVRIRRHQGHVSVDDESYPSTR